MSYNEVNKRIPASMKNVPFSPQERSRIAKALNKQLGPEYLSKRRGAGGSNVTYIEGFKAINLANELFTPFGWSSDVQSSQVDYVEEKNGRVSLGLYAVVRVTLKDGTYHEDIGYGSIEGARTKAAAFDKCRKEAITDGIKRALRQFGNALGNCIYDKDYLSKIGKVSAEPTEFQQESLLRRSHHGTMGHDEEAALASAAPTALITSGNSTSSSAASTALSNTVTLVRDPQIKTDEIIALPPVTTTHIQQQQKQNAHFSKPPVKKQERQDDEDSFVFSDDYPDEAILSRPSQKVKEVKSSLPTTVNEIPDSDNDFDDDEPDVESIVHNSKNQNHSTSIEHPDVNQNNNNYNNRVPLKDSTVQLNNLHNQTTDSNANMKPQFQKPLGCSAQITTPRAPGPINLNLSQPTPTPNNNPNATPNMGINMNLNDPNSNIAIPKNVGFVAARSAEKVMKDPRLHESPALKYDPTHHSESIKKSTFVNHSKSTPIKRSLIQSSTSVSGGSGPNVGSNPGLGSAGGMGGGVAGSGNPFSNHPRPYKRSIGLPPDKLMNKRLHK
ncbi:unnamed protein product [Ambrosiozyma monospora]|uniref:Unnamed protein product n=1 Tax=Ambrosiozyma monospora TaxID=43982 RepID=A0ACB5T1W2_AMBMO|nr:unnamed protein product [Ambrosiozyma monospora]